jgi:hypothetical protein
MVSQVHLRSDPAAADLRALVRVLQSGAQPGACLLWDGSGLWVATKRLERGTFDWPTNGGGAAEVSANPRRYRFMRLGLPPSTGVTGPTALSH